MPHTVHKIYNSHCENVLILDISIRNFRTLLISCYGPVQSNNNQFFSNLRSKIESINVKHFILLGDCNAITSLLPINNNHNFSNIELSNTLGIPNPIHSRHLVDWLASGNLIDKFRALYPTKREYSYIPFNKQALNRSRIDHIFVSKYTSDFIFNVEYKNILCRSFDHKPIVVSLGKKQCKIEKIIDSSLLHIPNLYDSTKYNVMEFYVNNFDLPNKPELLLLLDRINNHSRSLQLLESFQNNYPNDLLCKAWINDLTLIIENLCNLFPSIDSFWEHPCNIQPDVFLESLMNNIKNSVISTQSSFVKQLRNKKITLGSELNSLKNSGDFESTKFKDLEFQLLEIEHNENMRLLQDTKYFNVLNHEKPSKAFSEILRNKNNDSSFSSLKDHNGNAFINPRDRNQFLVNHFSEQFSNDSNPTLSLSDFYGPDINHEIVQNHRLNNIDKLVLDEDFSIEELDEVLNTANLASAPGIDGFPMKAIKTFWVLLRRAVIKAFNFMGTNGELHGLMKISKIRLIPKAGKTNPHSIKDYRPIGILCAIYKLYSGLINFRLKKVVDKISYRSQKAYSSRYFLQENLTNVIETISKSNATNTPLATMCIDFSRAFDVVSHKYIEDVLKFYNFGPKFTKIIMSTLKNRAACIMTDIGLTVNFFMRSGVIQGDLAAPNVFKLAENPLIIKLCISQIINIPPQIPYKLNFFQPKPDSSPAYADDLETFMSPEPESLQACTDIINNFGKMSHLNINNSKTKIMVSGGLPSLNFLRKVEELGYSISQEIKILGLTINRALDNMDSNWDDILTKVHKLSNFWNLFHLSIPGRVNVVKCYFLSQLSHLGGILEPNQNFLTEFTNIIVNFLKQGGKISKARIFETVDKGGLGIPNPCTFLQSLKVSICIKGFKSYDTWGLELKNYCLIPGIPHSINWTDINSELNPILKIISKYYLIFCENFWKKVGNILHSPILGNNLFLVNGHKIDRSFFSNHSWIQSNLELKNLRLKDFLNNNRLINFNLFRIDNNCHINIDEFSRLSLCLRPLITKYKSKFTLNSTPIGTFLSRPNIKSKDFRIFFDLNSHKIQNCRPSKSRYAWTTEIFDFKRESRWISCWNFSFLPMNMRDFAFKFLNNGLLLNANLAHFDNLNVDPSCTLCSLSKRNPPPKENYPHFFLYCNTNINISLVYFSNFLANSNITWDQKFFFLGAPTNATNWCSMIINVEIILVSFFLFQCRTEKKIPLINNLMYFTKSNRNILLLSCKYYRAWVKWNSITI